MAENAPKMILHLFENTLKSSFQASSTFCDNGALQNFKLIHCLTRDGKNNQVV